MNRLNFLLLIIIALVVGCSKNEDNSKVNTDTKDNLVTTLHQGEVIDKIDTGNYSYLEIKENNKDYWIAVPTMNIEKGEKIFFSQYMEMKDFRSETLNRTFKSVLFVNDARKSQTQMSMQNMHPDVKSQKNEDLKIAPITDGKTISQIYQGKNSLKGKSIKVRGKVVKYNANIMNRNWIHIQDGTGDSDSYDLLVTSNTVVSVGDVIIAEGVLALDKDFGAGYTYKVLLENAKIIKQERL